MPPKVTFNVTGMTCDHCVHAVTEAIQGVEGVASAQVSLADKSAVVEGNPIDVDKIIAAVKEEGYEAVPA